MVAFARPQEEAAVEMPSGPPGVAGRPRDHTWAALMHRAFGLDLLACPRCGGRLRLFATISDPAIVEQILAHLGLASAPRPPGPAPPIGTAVIAQS